MNYEMRHIATLPETGNRPAYAGDLMTYVQSVVTIAASEGAASAPPDTRAHMCARPEGAGAWAWLYFGPVAGLTLADIESAFDSCIYDDGDRMEVTIKWLADAEDG